MPARLVCVTGQSAHERTDYVQVAVDQSGVGTSRESFSYLVSFLQTNHPIVLLLLPLLLCLLFLLLSPLALPLEERAVPSVSAEC